MIWFQSASSSSATNIGSIVLMPWPISGFLPTMVMVLSGAIEMNALSVAGVGAAPTAARAITGIVADNISPPPASAPALSSVRRESAMRS